MSVRREDGGTDEHRDWPASPTEVFGSAVPWRTFRWHEGQRHYSGSYWCATTSGHVIYESRLELARLLYADFDRSVRSVVAQPFLLQAQVDGVARRHIPDFLLLREGGVPLVVEVKPRRLVDTPKVAFCLGWARQLVEAHGWGFEVWSEPPEAELANLRFLAGYRRAWLFDVGLLGEIRGRGDLDGVAFGEAVRSFPHQPAPLVRSAVLHLLWEQFFYHRPAHPLAGVPPAAAERGVVSGAVRLGVGTRLVYDGEVVTVERLLGSPAGCEVLARDGRGRPLRLSLRELLTAERARVVPTESGPAADDAGEVAATVLAQLSEPERQKVLERAAHVREVLTGYRSGSAALAAPGEPRPAYGPAVSLMTRYAAKAAELGVGDRTIRRWVRRFQQDGEAGLVSADGAHGPGVAGIGGLGRADARWVETALEVMAEHADESTPSHSIVIRRTAARLAARHGVGMVPLPSRATAYRWLEELEQRRPTFRLSAKRNREAAARPGTVYGKLRPTRPGEYLLLDTTRLDVFAMDPLTLRWVQAELTAAMDWYTRCITGLRLTPVSTKSIDASAVLFQTYRPRPAAATWPRHAVWPDHGVPRAVLLDAGAVEGPMIEAAVATGWAASPPLAPETVVVDHGKIYVSEHLTSVCRRMGISVQPARLRTGRDKGPLERFFRTLREDLLEALPGYKGPNVHARGLDPEGEAFFFLNELEAIIREWIAVVYHHRPHGGLVDPHLPGLLLSPAAMFEHGLERAGYVEVPRDPDLGFEFLQTKWRQIHHYGIEIRRRRYNGPALDPYREITSPYTGQAKGRWPVQVDPDDINRVYFRDPASRRWHALIWEHAPAVDMPLSDEALQFARRMAATKYTYPDDKLAVADLLERWNLGLGMSMAERRMALRISREQAAVDLPSLDEVSSLPSVRKVLELPPATTSEPAASHDAGMTSGRAWEPEPPEPGDDDDVDELDPADSDLAEDDFYADALEDVE